MNRERRDAVIEVFAERPLLRGPVQVLVRRRQHAHVHLARRALAERVDFALLQEAQELRLQGERQVAYLVEEERAALGRADESVVVRVRARERALAVPEQEALD